MNLDFLAVPLGKVMQFIFYNLSFDNYGFTIIIFTIITRLAIFPLNMRQFRSTAKMQQLNPKLEELKKMYGHDKQRLQEETMKLYQEEKINPMASCLPLFIQFPILITLNSIITKPLQYILEKTTAQLDRITEVYKAINEIGEKVQVQQIEMLNFFRNSPEYLSGLTDTLNQSELFSMSFLGLDLSKKPSFSPSVIFGSEMSTYLPLLLIPIIGVLISYLSTKISMVGTSAMSQGNQQAQSMNRSMMIMGPVMTLIFSFQLPAGVLLYWITGYVIQIFTQLYVNKYIYKVDKKQVEQQTYKSRKKSASKGSSQPGMNNADADIKVIDAADVVDVIDTGKDVNTGMAVKGGEGVEGVEGVEGAKRNTGKSKGGIDAGAGSGVGTIASASASSSSGKGSSHRTSTYKNYGSKKKKKKL
jgi:YidC/Oxa1 family membrane protein insertase